nr:MAG TPA: hypothetical protein [Caudoviricetes sp.]
MHHLYVFSTFVPLRLSFHYPLWCRALPITCNSSCVLYRLLDIRAVVVFILR